MTLTLGPPLGPFSSIQDWCRSVLQFTMEQLETHPYLKPVKPLLDDILPILLSKLEKHYEARPEDSEIVLCHLDLHPGNILVDPETLRITAILDWEHAKSFPWWLQWINARLFWEEESSPEEHMPEFMDEQLQRLTGKTYTPSPKDVDLDEEDVIIETIDSLVARDILDYCSWIQFWNPTFWIQDQLDTEPSLEDLKKQTMESIQRVIQENTEMLIKLSKRIQKLQ